ncbi:hypothetical protein PoB_004614500 [Plakobranchus ocellatus]|uniref:Uncharacterized protein n=1 Tax=Plakobranchus ocellatus TaxID=259542 RepID=A0AAV4BJH9_9GAST|nr:hypothetical protein PoB_004614500 [Plakobranchus ocellatus]
MEPALVLSPSTVTSPLWGKEGPQGFNSFSTRTQRLPRSPAKRNLARNSSRTPGLQRSFTYRTMRRTSTWDGLSSFPRKMTSRSAKRAWTFEANQLQTERQKCVGARLPSDSTSGDGYTVSSTNTDNKEKRKQDT